MWVRQTYRAAAFWKPEPASMPRMVSQHLHSTPQTLVIVCMQWQGGWSSQCFLLLVLLGQVVQSSVVSSLLLQDLVKTAEEWWFPVPSDEEMYAAAPLYGVDEVLCKELMYR